jgi:adenylate cyclase
MIIFGKIRRRLDQSFNVLRRYRYRWVLLIALTWTALDLLLWAIRASVPQAAAYTDIEHTRDINYVAIRSSVVFGMSLMMGWLIVFKFRTLFRNKPLQVNLALKTLILMACSFFMNFFNLFGYFYFITRRTVLESITFYFKLPAEKFWLVHGLPLWLLIFLITQLFIEMSEKYSPGVFADILRGKYIDPKIEKRIVMFLDLKDSTPIAESLGHKNYFLFIREFIDIISLALLEHDSRIYQYVGDEIVASWIFSEENAVKAIRAIIEARKTLQAKSEQFRRKYNVTPEFRVGMHAGDVTVGEIGLIKKDIAMSGDTMNTAARIRSATSELNQKFLVSKDFLDLSSLKEYQSEALGSIELKGKSSNMELFALKI